MKMINSYRAANYIWCVCLLLVSGLMLWSCRDHKKTPKGDSPRQQPISSTEKRTLTENGEMITLERAKQLSENWQMRTNFDSDCSKRNTKPLAYYVSPGDLKDMINEAVLGVRIYFGFTSLAKDQDTIKLVYSPVLNNGNDAISAGGKVYDFSSPCPTICDNNAYITGECPSNLLLHTMNVIDHKLAMSYIANWRIWHNLRFDCKADTSSIVRSYLIPLEVLQIIKKEADKPNGTDTGGMSIYFGCSKIGERDSIYLMLVPAVEDINGSPDSVSSSIFLASKTCPGDSCTCQSPLVTGQHP